MARMTRKKPVRAEEEEFDVDDPSEVDESQNDNDGDSSSNDASRRKSGRQRASAKKSYKDDASSDEDGQDDEEDEDSDEEKPPKKKAEKKKPAKANAGRGRAKGKPPAKKQKVEEENDDSEDIDGEESEGDAADTPLEYRSGCFVVLKSDVDNKVEDHPLWKIDGKSLLQKFDKTKKDDEVLFKSTTTYAGWSKTIMDTYYPIQVEFEKLDDSNGSIVKFNPDQLEKLKKEPVTATENAEVKEE